MRRAIDRASAGRDHADAITAPRGGADFLLAVVLVRAATRGAAMGHVRHSIHVDAPPDAAWRIGRDANRIPEWNTTVASVKDVSGPLDVVGASYTAISKIVGRPLEVIWRVERVEPMRLGEAVATAPGGGTGRTRVAYEPDGSGTRMTIDLDYELPGGFLGGVVDKLFAERAMERDVRHSSENFKALVEQEAAVLAHR